MKRIITAIAIFFCFCTLVGAQTDITRETLVAEGDSVKVSFSVDSERGVPKRRKEVIMPYIYNGRDTLFLFLLCLDSCLCFFLCLKLSLLLL